MVQFVPYELVFTTHSPSMRESINVSIMLNGEKVGSVESKSRVVNKFSILSVEYGISDIKLVSGDLEYSMAADILETTMDISEITSGLVLNFSSIGRVNTSLDRNVWKDGVHTARFIGFNWNNTSRLGK